MKNTIVTSRYRLHAAPKTCVKTKGNLMKKKYNVFDIGYENNFFHSLDRIFFLFSPMKVSKIELYWKDKFHIQHQNIKYLLYITYLL